MSPHWVHYLPLATTLLCAGLCAALLARHHGRPGRPHLLWWALGMATYGSGTALESWITLAGTSAALTKTWYVAGAILGGYPLAQGSAYLHLSRTRAHRLTAISVPFVAAVVLLVVLAPVDPTRLETHRPTGAVIAWTWLRALTPVINVYALVFLVGGAAVSASRYVRSQAHRGGRRAAGNIAIAVGGALPGIGGASAKVGSVEALYVAELLGIVLLGTGFALCVGAGWSHPASRLTRGPARSLERAGEVTRQRATLAGAAR